MTELYNELLKATDNISDICFPRHGIITKIDNNLCNVKELDTDMEHLNVAIINGYDLKIGDKVLLGFANNSTYNPLILGVIGRSINTELEEKLDSMVEESLKAQGLPFFNIDTNGYLIASYGFLKENIFSIDTNGHLIVTLPSGQANPFTINSEGNIIYEE